MNDNQRTRQNRNEKVFQFIDENQTELNTTAAVTEPIKDLLETKIAETLANDMVATQDNTGIAETKNEERDELVKDARECLNFLVKHFTTNNNRTMLRQIDYKMEDLENANDTLMQENAMRINEIATPLMVALTALGYTAGMKTAFDTNLEDFRLMKGKPRVAIGQSSSYGVEVDVNLTEADALLDKMDIEINLIQFSKPILYRSYYIIRKIDDAPSISSNTVTDTVDIGGTKKVRTIAYNAADTITIKVTGTEPVAFSFKDGGADVGAPIKVLGATTVTKSHADFAPSGDELWATSGSLLGPSAYKVTFN